MAKLTQKQLIEQQSIAIQTLSSRLIEVEVLLASVIDLATDKKLLERGELESMINSKVAILNSKIEYLKTKEVEDINDTKMESFPYFGKPGEA